MRTKKDERDRWGSVGVYARVPPADVYRLIADVDDAVKLLEEWMNGKELPVHWTDRVRTFLEERPHEEESL